MSETKQRKGVDSADCSASYSQCCTCGFRWITGKHGGHSCASHLAEKLRIASAALQRVSANRYNRYESTAGVVANIADEALGKISLENASAMAPATLEHESKKDVMAG